MAYDDNNSSYIKPFLSSNKELEKAMNEHVMHQYPLSSEKKRLEGTVMPYAKENNDYIKRR